MSTPKEQWAAAEALVYSVDWIEPVRYGAGHYDVVYSYRVGENRFTGQFSDYCDPPTDCLHVNDAISIRYCPERPEVSFYPDAQSGPSKIVPLLVGAALGVIGLILLFVKHRAQ